MIHTFCCLPQASRVMDYVATTCNVWSERGKDEDIKSLNVASSFETASPSQRIRIILTTVRLALTNPTNNHTNPSALTLRTLLNCELYEPDIAAILYLAGKRSPNFPVHKRLVPGLLSLAGASTKGLLVRLACNAPKTFSSIVEALVIPLQSPNLSPSHSVNSCHSSPQSYIQAVYDCLKHLACLSRRCAKYIRDTVVRTLEALSPALKSRRKGLCALALWLTVEHVKDSIGFLTKMLLSPQVKVNQGAYHAFLSYLKAGQDQEQHDDIVNWLFDHLSQAVDTDGAEYDAKGTDIVDPLPERVAAVRLWCGLLGLNLAPVNPPGPISAGVRKLFSTLLDQKQDTDIKRAGLGVCSVYFLLADTPLTPDFALLLTTLFDQGSSCRWMFLFAACCCGENTQNTFTSFKTYSHSSSSSDERIRGSAALADAAGLPKRTVSISMSRWTGISRFVRENVAPPDRLLERILETASELEQPESQTSAQPMTGYLIDALTRLFQLGTVAKCVESVGPNASPSASPDMSGPVAKNKILTGIGRFVNGVISRSSLPLKVSIYRLINEVITLGLKIRANLEDIPALAPPSILSNTQGSANAPKDSKRRTGGNFPPAERAEAERRLRNFLQSQALTLPLRDLNARERALYHDVAEGLGLDHRSIGKGPERQLVISRGSQQQNSKQTRASPPYASPGHSNRSRSGSTCGGGNSSKGNNGPLRCYVMGTRSAPPEGIPEPLVSKSALLHHIEHKQPQPESSFQDIGTQKGIKTHGTQGSEIRAANLPPSRVLATFYALQYDVMAWGLLIRPFDISATSSKKNSETLCTRLVRAASLIQYGGEVLDGAPLGAMLAMLEDDDKGKGYPVEMRRRFGELARIVYAYLRKNDTRKRRDQDTPTSLTLPIKRRRHGTQLSGDNKLDGLKQGSTEHKASGSSSKSRDVENEVEWGAPGREEMEDVLKSIPRLFRKPPMTSKDRKAWTDKWDRLWRRTPPSFFLRSIKLMLLNLPDTLNSAKSGQFEWLAFDSLAREPLVVLKVLLKAEKAAEAVGGEQRLAVLDLILQILSDAMDLSESFYLRLASAEMASKGHTVGSNPIFQQMQTQQKISPAQSREPIRVAEALLHAQETAVIQRLLRRCQIRRETRINRTGGGWFRFQNHILEKNHFFPRNNHNSSAPKSDAGASGYTFRGRQEDKESESSYEWEEWVLVSRYVQSRLNNRHQLLQTLHHQRYHEDLIPLLVETVPAMRSLLPFLPHFLRPPPPAEMEEALNACTFGINLVSCLARKYPTVESREAVRCLFQSIPLKDRETKMWERWRPALERSAQALVTLALAYREYSPQTACIILRLKLGVTLRVASRSRMAQVLDMSEYLVGGAAVGTDVTSAELESLFLQLVQEFNSS
ncbi:hypothetical protein AAMO2058_001113800 [Amorphochlora amoebiformis]